VDDETIISAFEVEWLNLIEMDYLEYKGYKGTVGYSKEDDCLVGKVIGMHDALILYEGKTLDDLKEDFRNAVDSYIESCLANGNVPKKPFSGKLIVRMPSELHGRIAVAAADHNTTINDFINSTLSSALSADVI